MSRTPVRQQIVGFIMDRWPRQACQTGTIAQLRGFVRGVRDKILIFQRTRCQRMKFAPDLPTLTRGIEQAGHVGGANRGQLADL